MNLNIIANNLDRAAMDAEAIEQISKTRALNLDEAYAIQSISMSKRYLRNEKRIGIKMGFTSKAKMEQMGVHDMIWGRLTDGMYYANNSDLPLDLFIHPRAEPEIAFKLAKDIHGEVPLDEIKDYVESVAVAIEIIDSRFQNFKFSLEDVIADNCSSTGFSVGKWMPVDTKITDISIQLLADGELIHAGNSNAILGNPWESLVAATRLAAEYGEPLLTGDIVLAGAATPAVYIKSGQTIQAVADGLGDVNLNVR